MYDRKLSVTIQLSDPTEYERGDFKFQDVASVTDSVDLKKKGTVLIWPGSYTHLHRGNPPMTDKYIATGWYQGNIGLQTVHTAGILDKQYQESLGSE